MDAAYVFYLFHQSIPLMVESSCKTSRFLPISYWYVLELMDGRGLVLLKGLSRLHIYPPSGAHMRMIQGSEKV